MEINKLIQIKSVKIWNWKYLIELLLEVKKRLWFNLCRTYFAAEVVGNGALAFIPREAFQGYNRNYLTNTRSRF